LEWIVNPGLCCASPSQSLVCKIVAGVEPIEALVKLLDGSEGNKVQKRFAKQTGLFDNVPLSERSVRVCYNPHPFPLLIGFLSA
jgi:hypothetical protein